MVCVNCNYPITRQNDICPNCQMRTGVGSIGLLNTGYVLGGIGIILGFGPTFYFNAILSGSVANPASDLGQGISYFITGITISVLGGGLGLAGLIMVIVALSQKKYRKTR